MNATVSDLTDTRDCSALGYPAGELMRQPLYIASSALCAVSARCFAHESCQGRREKR